MAGNNDKNDQPGWLTATIRDAGVRGGLILYGNVRDIFFDPDRREYVTLSGLLLRVLTRDRALDFTLAGIWDQADGLRFPDERALTRFREAVGQRNPASAPGGEAYDVGDRKPAARTTTSDMRLHANPCELMPAMRRVLHSDAERPLFVLDWTHLLVTQPAHPDREERPWILEMGKALIGDAIAPMDSDHLQRNRGLIVLVAANLGNLPPILYQGGGPAHPFDQRPGPRPARKAGLLPTPRRRPTLRASQTCGKRNAGRRGRKWP